MDPSERPVIEKGMHPVELHDYTIPTRSIEDMANALFQWADIHLPGAIIYGTPRLGKTTAIVYFIEHIEEIMGAPIPAYIYSCPEESNNREGRFIEDLLFAVNYGLAESGNAAKKLRRFIQFLEERAKQCVVNRVMLFIDEAQWLNEMHFKTLMNVHNQLKLKRVNLTIILVGQPELLELKNAYLASRQQQIIARFMANTYRFHGIQSQRDIKRILRAFDVDSIYPEDSGWSFTRYFLPVAFENGWRFADQTQTIWQAFQEIRKDHGMKKLSEIPLEPFTSLVNFLLRELSEDDERNLVLDIRDVKKAIGYVCYIQLEQHAHTMAVA